MREQCVPGPLLSFVGPGNEAREREREREGGRKRVHSHLIPRSLSWSKICRPLLLVQHHLPASSNSLEKIICMSNFPRET